MMLQIPSDVFVVKDVTVRASLSYTSRVWSNMLRLVVNRLVDLDKIVTHRFPAEQYADAYDLMDNRRGLVAKIILEHAGADPPDDSFVGHSSGIARSRGLPP